MPTQRSPHRRYPHAPRGTHIDTYQGTNVADPYRWLEHSTDPRTVDWIAAQSRLTEEFCSALPERAELLARFAQLLEYPRYYDLISRGPYLFFKKNEGMRNQLAIYFQRSGGSGPELLVDPIAFSADGTTSATAVVPDRTGRYVAYGLSHLGSDWQEYHIKDMVTRQDLPEIIRWVKFSSVSWHADGFYYSRYPAPEDGTSERTRRDANHQVHYHRIGTPQSADVLTYEARAHPDRLGLVYTTPNEEFALLSVRDPAAGQHGNSLSVRMLRSNDQRWHSIVASFNFDITAFDAWDGRVLALTTADAVNGRIVSIDPHMPDIRHWHTLIPEGVDPIEAVVPVGQRLFVTYRHLTGHLLCVFAQDGELQDEIVLPGVGLVNVFPGTHDAVDALWSYQSCATPTTIYRYSIATARSSALYEPAAPFTVAEYATRLVHYPSRDGTSVPMLMVHRHGLELSGNHPLLLSGYGGNGAVIGPRFDPLLIALLERGVVFASACVRGGGEYGETWHRAGCRERKQVSFDDFIAAAEWLQAGGYTSRERLAITGVSNGGLLVGAVMTQRPDLFRVALPQVGVFDMLRFQHFTIGRAWTAEYGSSDDAAMFRLLLAYSPLHNVRPGVRYPATLVTTSANDDRVVPMHSYKFAAALQHADDGDYPQLIRISRHSGHGPVNLQEALNERADVYAFLLSQIGNR